MATKFIKGPFGGHHFGGDSSPAITFQVVPCSNSWPYVNIIRYVCMRMAYRQNASEEYRGLTHP